MNRRELLKTLPAPLLIGLVPVALCASEDPQLQKVREITQDWTAKECYGKQGPTIFCFDEQIGYEIIQKPDGFDIHRRELSQSEREGLQEYKAGLDRHVPQRIGTAVHNGEYQIRGWVYNSRHPKAWLMSVERV